MNIYKNLMFLHGHFVDPRDADDDSDDGAQIGRRAASTVAADAGSKTAVSGAKAGTTAATASHRVQATRTGATTGWRAWLQLWPAQSARVESLTDCGAHGCT
ncbi:hypothetical protein [Lysobacter sp. Root690]|uniref:hypothetical protein n=1 Tax=Lysobacter sp. Root690 TaxID=1736588 RepID=UPI0007020F0B|nr:hypothetical protein [Lysobacter sp. Root690]KRB07754.1 hypothetical protein ASD86_08005 [Lysobacter sp. Root690]